MEIVFFFMGVAGFLAAVAGILAAVWVSGRAKQQHLQGEAIQKALEARAHKLDAEVSELQRRLQQSEITDHLTGLPGRRIFEDRLVIMLGQGARYHLTCAVMVIDLDHFRVVNDALGLEAGDLVLKEVAGRLQTCLRQLDTVSRFAGDEFVLLLPQISRAETAGHIAQRIMEAVNRPFRIHDQDVWLTTSIGIAIFPADGEDAKTLVQNARAALRSAKESERNTCRFYRTEMQTLGRRELVLGGDLRKELISQDFFLAWQPEIHLQNQKIICMEGMLWWQHPEFGRVRYDEFVHLAENAGKILAVGEWMLHAASHDILLWRERKLPMLSVLLPLSLRQLEKLHFVQYLSTILQDYHLEPELFIFEIANSAAFAQVDAIEKMLGMMKHLGVRIAINGLGTHTLPLQKLHRLPVDIFKISDELIRDIVLNRESQALVKMILALATSLNAEVVAGGVESPAQKKMLLEMGCRVMQGTLFSQPLSADELTLERMKNITEGTPQPVV